MNWDSFKDVCKIVLWCDFQTCIYLYFAFTFFCLYNFKKCSEDARERLPLNPGDAELSKYQHHFEYCTVACVDRHIGLIPTMMKTIKAVLEKGPQALPQA